MNTFPGWRAVARAMRWARQQDHIRISASTEVSLATVTDNRWQWSDALVVATHAVGYNRTDVEISRDHTRLTFFGVRDAAEVLRVLVALDLIPAELAEGDPNERYAFCDHCGRLITFVSGHGMWPDRWVHVDVALWAQWGPHRAEANADSTPPQAGIHNCTPHCPSPCPLDDEDPRGWQG